MIGRLYFPGLCQSECSGHDCRPSQVLVRSHQVPSVMGVIPGNLSMTG